MFIIYISTCLPPDRRRMPLIYAVIYEEELFRRLCAAKEARFLWSFKLNSAISEDDMCR